MSEDRQERFAAYVEALAEVIGHADRAEPLHDYCRGLRRLRFPKIVHPEAPPVRPERHVANSIATMRRHLIVALATTLARCPCCNAPRKTTHATPIL